MKNVLSIIRSLVSWDNKTYPVIQWWAVNGRANLDTRDISTCPPKQFNILIKINGRVWAGQIKLRMDKRPCFGVLSWEKNVNIERKKLETILQDCLSFFLIALIKDRFWIILGRNWLCYRCIYIYIGNKIFIYGVWRYVSIG